MRPVLVAIWYPEGRAVNAQHRWAASPMCFKLLMVMVSHNSVKEVFDGSNAKSVTRLDRCC